MSRPSRALAALACTAVIVAAGVAPATAADWSHADAVGDVQTITIDEETGEESELTPDPTNVDTDVTRMVVRHRTHTVALRMNLRDIRRSSGGAFFDIRTDGRDYFAIKRLGRDEFVPGWVLVGQRGRAVRCPEVRRYVDRSAELAVARIPRRCLGYPEWVRVGAGVQGFQESPDGFGFSLDDALTDGGVLDVLELSPRVYRG